MLFKNINNKNLFLFNILTITLFNISAPSLATSFRGYLNEVNNTQVGENLSNAVSQSAGLIEKDTWETLPTSMPINRAYLSTVAIDEKIYLIGGLDESSLTRLDIYDTKTNTWDTSKAPMPTARQRLASVEVNGKIYAIGGWDGSAYLNTVEMYDPSTNTWTTKASMPTARYGFAASVVDGKVYCIGGYSLSGPSNVVEMYDPSTNTWTTKASMPTARFNFSSGAINKKIYCVGGSDGSYLDTIEEYDTSSNTWIKKTAMPTARYGLSVSVSDNKLYCIGGYNGSYLTTTEVYDPIVNSWETKAPMAEARFGFSSVTINKRIYALGGLNSSSKLKSIECYIVSLTLEEIAQNAVIKAETSKNTDEIKDALELVKQLPDSSLKTELLERLDLLIPKKSTSMIDVYITPQNNLSLSLDTNMVVFDDYSGIGDIEKLNAISLSVTSTLPYSIKTYLETDIKNSDGYNALPMNILKIRVNGQPNYLTFPALSTPITLLSNQPYTLNTTHGIDLMLQGSVLKEADVYKASVKFEVVQE